MKRSISVLAAVVVLATSMSALADNGDIRENNGKVTINTNQVDKYTTVLIVKGNKTDENIDNISADEIVYINQSGSAYSSAVDFLLKSDVIGAKADTYTVKMGGATLKAGTDYAVAYADNTNAGTAAVTITGKGNYAGTLKATFNINAVDLSKASIDAIADQIYTGSALEPGKGRKKTLGGTVSA